MKSDGVIGYGTIAVASGRRLHTPPRASHYRETQRVLAFCTPVAGRASTGLGSTRLAPEPGVPTRRIFLLSPARCDGERAKLLIDPEGRSALAAQLREPEGAPIGDVFTFMSSLYFRGKLTYARAFADPPPAVPPALVITTDRGLMSPDEHIRRDELVAFACVDISTADERYLAPLRRDAMALARSIETFDTLVVLLGSIATGKYADVLLEVFGERLVFPAAFVGRGDMSRGGLLLRQVRDGRELDYVSVDGAVRRGRRPPKLAPLRRTKRRPDDRLEENA
jgi:hypothetical protein